MQRQELLEVEARHRDDRGAGSQTGVHEHLHAVDVEERQHRDEGIVGLHRDRRECLLDVRDEVAVGQHDALRQAGRARGVRQHDDVVEVDRHLFRERLAGKRGDRRVAIGLTDDEHFFHGRVGHRRGRRLQEGRDRHEARRARVDELVMDLPRCVRRVHRGQHPAGQRDRVEDDAVLGTVGRHHRDDFTLRQPVL